MGSSPGVYRATYKDKKTGEQREAKTWVATWWDPVRHRTRKKYGFRTAKEAQEHRSKVSAFGLATESTLTLGQLLAFIIDDYKLHDRASLPAAEHWCEVLKDSLSPYARKPPEPFEPDLEEPNPGLRPVHTIDDDAIDDHMVRMRADGYSKASINRMLSVLKRAYRLAKKRKHRGLVVPDMAMMDESDNVRQGFPAPDELQRILAHLAPHAHPVVRTVQVTGWRISEVLSRRWSDIENGFLRIRHGEAKNKRPRAWPMEPDLTAIFKDLPRDSDWIFTYRRPKPKRKDRPQEYYLPEPIISITKTWNTARKKAGLPTRLLHDYRRGAVRDLIKSGVDRVTAKKLSGHVTDSVFERYQIVGEDDLIDAAKALSKFRKTRDGLGMSGSEPQPKGEN